MDGGPAPVWSTEVAIVCGIRRIDSFPYLGRFPEFADRGGLGAFYIRVYYCQDDFTGLRGV